MSMTLAPVRPAAPLEQDLTAGAAVERLHADRPNELPQEKRRGPFRFVPEAVREPMPQLLLGAGVVYLVIGDLAGALMPLASTAVNVALVMVQESRTERALAALKDLTAA